MTEPELAVWTAVGGLLIGITRKGTHVNFGFKEELPVREQTRSEIGAREGTEKAIHRATPCPL